MHATCVDIKFVMIYLPRKVVWNFILIQKVARKKSIFNSASKFDFRTCWLNAEWIFPLLVSSYTCSIHMWSWETCIQSLCGKMAKQQSSLVNILAKLAKSEEVVQVCWYFWCKSVLKQNSFRWSAVSFFFAVILRLFFPLLDCESDRDFW